MAISPSRGSSTLPALGFPLSRVYGVATFYNLFQLSPPGRYLVRICKGTACHVNRSADILARGTSATRHWGRCNHARRLADLADSRVSGRAAWRR